MLNRATAHIQNGIGIPLFIQVCSFVNSKSHVFIKSFGLRILFIYRQSLDGIGFDPVLDQPFSQTFSPFFRSDEQHFQSVALDPHKGHGAACFIFRKYQVGNFVQRLRHVFFYALDFAVR